MFLDYFFITLFAFLSFTLILALTIHWSLANFPLLQTVTSFIMSRLFVAMKLISTATLKGDFHVHFLRVLFLFYHRMLCFRQFKGIIFGKSQQGFVLLHFVNLHHDYPSQFTQQPFPYFRNKVSHNHIIMSRPSVHKCLNVYKK